MSPGVSGGLGGLLPSQTPQTNANDDVEQPQAAPRSANASLAELFMTPEYIAAPSVRPEQGAEKDEQPLLQPVSDAPPPPVVDDLKGIPPVPEPAKKPRMPALTDDARAAAAAAAALAMGTGAPGDEEIAHAAPVRPSQLAMTLPTPDAAKLQANNAVEAAQRAAAAKADRFADQRRRQRAAAAAVAAASRPAPQLRLDDGLPGKRHRESISLDDEHDGSGGGAVSSDPDAGPLGEEDIKKKRYQRRLELNRQSAAVSRVRRREYVKELEDKLVAVEKDKFKLQSQVDLMGDENIRLRAQMKALQTQLGKPPSDLPAPAGLGDPSGGPHASGPGSKGPI